MQNQEEQKHLLESLFQTLLRFSTDKIDPMEFFLLKSIALFKSDSKQLQDKMRIDMYQEESFMSLFNYNKLNYPAYPRFGRLLILYSDLRRFAQSKLVEDYFVKNFINNGMMVSSNQVNNNNNMNSRLNGNDFYAELCKLAQTHQQIV
jgi:hypothetical protein